MLTIKIPLEELYDENSNEFVETSHYELKLEHSLVSLSKWESDYEKPFLSDNNKSNDEIYGYIECMCLEDPPENLLKLLTSDHLQKIHDYINAKRTATWFREESRNKVSNETITSELIYYWMVALTIPFECENWHLNRLLTLIRICNHMQQKQKPMSKAELAARNRELNAKRRAEMNSSG